MTSSRDESELVLFQTEDGITRRLRVRFVEGTIWLTQLQLANLYQVGDHRAIVHTEGELAPEATVKSYLTVRAERNRSAPARSSTGLGRRGNRLRSPPGRGHAVFIQDRATRVAGDQ